MKTEQEIKDKIENSNNVIYLDETGAGPLCGDLFVCGLILPKEHNLLGLADSKKLSEKKRDKLYQPILDIAIDYEIVRISAEEIDQINILQARMEGFRRAIEILAKRNNSNYAVIDGNKAPTHTSIETDVLIKADAILEGVSAASIVAKVARDNYITELSAQEPYKLYGLEKHKGYGTAVHMEALNKYGPIKGFHRLSYAPVKAAADKFQ